MKQVKLFFILCLIFSMFGCASKHNMGHYFQPKSHLAENQNYAHIYFYFPNHGLPKGDKGTTIFANNHEVVSLSNATYSEVYLKPGTYSIHTPKRYRVIAHVYDNQELVATFMAGETYYIEFSTRVSRHNQIYRVGNGTTTPVSVAAAYESELILLPEEKAYSAISLCHFVKPKKFVFDL